MNDETNKIDEKYSRLGEDYNKLNMRVFKLEFYLKLILAAATIFFISSTIGWISIGKVYKKIAYLYDETIRIDTKVKEVNDDFSISGRKCDEPDKHRYRCKFWYCCYKCCSFV